MAEQKIASLRNVVLLGHSGSGKTSLAEALAYDAGLTTRLGKVDEGTTISDYDPEEIGRKISINTSIIPCQWRAHKINVLDTPGYTDFVGEIKGATRAADGALILVDAVSGVEVGTELVWQYTDEASLPRLVFINKMDRENADFEGALAQLREKFEGRFIPVQLPIGSQEDFQGVLGPIGMKAFTSPSGEASDIPSFLLEEARGHRQQIMETAAELDDELIMKYLEGEELTEEEMCSTLRAGVLSGEIIPVLCGSALRNLGIQPLLDSLLEFLPTASEGAPIESTDPATGEKLTLMPSPLSPLSVLVFKTLADPFVGKLSYFRVWSGILQSDSRLFNSRSGQEERIGQLYILKGKEQESVDRILTGDIGAVAKLQQTLTGDTLCDKARPVILPPVDFPSPLYEAAIIPRSKADLDRMGGALPRLVEEDPTLHLRRDSDSGETILAGMGESHIDIAARRLQRKFGVEIEVRLPKVPYRETITKSASAQGRYKRQTGGRGQFGDVWLRLEPLPRGAGFEFVDEVRGGVVPKTYIPAVEKGLREAIQKGLLANYPTTDFRAALYDGSYHTVDSSEIAFKIAASLGFKKAVAQADPVLLEPIMKVTVTIPEEYMGDILGDLNARRARVTGMTQERGKSIISAEVPLAEMQRYATELRAITQGRGLYSMEFSHYDQVPSHVAEEVTAKARQEAEGN